MKIGLVGDYNTESLAHQAIPLALKMTTEKLGTEIQTEWVPTADIYDSTRVNQFDGLWCVPGSPYRNMDGALCAIQYAREHHVPFLGSCGGFQHAIIEYARNILGWENAEHAETSPGAQIQVIYPLSCSLVEKIKTVRFNSGTKIAAAYGRDEANEGYRCRYGLNPAFEAELTSGQLYVSARDGETREVRAIELRDHPFFVATLFQSERSALRGEIPPLVIAFIQAILQNMEQ